MNNVWGTYYPGRFSSPVVNPTGMIACVAQLSDGEEVEMPDQDAVRGSNMFAVVRAPIETPIRTAVRRADGLYAMKHQGWEAL